jgi:hypothetical protein
MVCRRTGCSEPTWTLPICGAEGEDGGEGGGSVRERGGRGGIGWPAAAAFSLLLPHFSTHVDRARRPARRLVDVLTVLGRQDQAGPGLSVVGGRRGELCVWGGEGGGRGEKESRRSACAAVERRATGARARERRAAAPPANKRQAANDSSADGMRHAYAHAMPSPSPLSARGQQAQAFRLLGGRPGGNSPPARRRCARRSFSPARPRTHNPTSTAALPTHTTIQTHLGRAGSGPGPQQGLAAGGAGADRGVRLHFFIKANTHTIKQHARAGGKTLRAAGGRVRGAAGPVGGRGGDAGRGWRARVVRNE